MTAMTKSTNVLVFPPKWGFPPVFDVMSARLMSQKTSRNSENTDLDEIAFFGGASRQCRGRRPLAQGCRNIASVDFLGEQKRRQCRYPAVSARQTLLFERKSAAPSMVNIIAVRQAATGYGTERISERAPNLDEKLSIWYIFVVRRALRRLLPLSLKGGGR